MPTKELIIVDMIAYYVLTLLKESNEEATIKIKSSSSANQRRMSLFSFIRYYVNEAIFKHILLRRKGLLE